MEPHLSVTHKNAPSGPKKQKEAANAIRGFFVFS